MLNTNVLLHYTRFCVSAWSNKPIKKIRVQYDKKADTLSTSRSSIDNYHVYIPNLVKVYPKISDLERLRLFRKSVWHEAMHIFFNTEVPDYYPADTSLGDYIFQITEDYKIEKLGLKFWPGMVFELAYWRAYHLSVFQPKDAVDEYYMLFKLHSSQQPKLLQQSEAKQIRQALEDYTEGKITMEQAIRIQYDILQRYYDETKDYYHYVDKLEQSAYQAVAQLTQKQRKQIMSQLKANYKQLIAKNTEPQVMAIIQQYKQSQRNDDHNDKDEDDSESDNEDNNNDDFDNIINNYEKDIPHKLQADFEALENEEKQQTAVDKETKGGIAHAQARVDYHAYYNGILINRLKAYLQQMKRGYVEVSGNEGEFDVESYINKQKPFIDYRWIGKKHKLTILLDISSSTWGYEAKYKMATITLVEALKYLGITFELIAFPRPTVEKKNFYEPFLVKSFSEPMSNVILERIAALYASGDTPLGETLKAVYERLHLYKPDIIIIFTDGRANNPDVVQKYSIKLQKLGIRIYGLGYNCYNDLKQYTWDNVTSISKIEDLPVALLRLLFNE